MAINKPVKKGTNQRFSKTKGLLDKVGKYDNKKSFNLTKKQLGAKGSKAASTRKIAITRTEYRNGKVYGPMNKPITGRVDMGGGNIAVYKNGVRVTAKKAAAPKPKGGPNNGGGGGGYVMPKRDASEAGKGTPMRPVSPRTPSGARANLSPRQIAAARRGEAADKRKGGNTPSGMSAATIRAVGRPASISQGAPPKPRPGSRGSGSGFSDGYAGGGGGGGGRNNIGRDTGNRKPTFYANGTARVWDSKLVKFVTVGKSDPRYPKRQQEEGSLMCMKCGCSTPNDKKSGPQNFGSNGGSGSQVIVKPTDTSSNGKLI